MLDSINQTLVVLDGDSHEPVAELDRESATDIMKLFNEYNRGGTAVVVASHKKLQLRQRCDVYFMYEGQIVEYSGGRRS